MRQHKHTDWASWWCFTVTPEIAGIETRSVAKAPLRSSLLRSWQSFSPPPNLCPVFERSVCVLSKPGEAASLCYRHRRVFDPGYLASSILSQPLEPSQGNWLTVWSPSDSTLVQDAHTHTNTFVTCKHLLMDGTHSHILSLTHVAHTHSTLPRNTKQSNTHPHAHSCYHLCVVK